MEPGPLDRLRLTEARIAGMADGLRAGRRAARPGRRGARRVAPAQRARRSSGCGCRSAWSRSSTRTGPTSPATPPGICLKSGNVAILRGLGDAPCARTSRSPRSSATALTKAGLPADAVLLVDDVRHEAAVELMQLTDVVDCLIPRGGPALIQSIRDHATVPVIIDGDGNCHVYVDALGRPRHARSTSWSTPRPSGPSVCNAAESLLVHESVADAFLPAVGDALVEQGVELVGDDGARARVADDGRGDRRRLRARVPRAQDERRRGAVDRRRHRPREPVRLRPHRGDPHRATSPRPSGSPTRSTPAPSS